MNDIGDDIGGLTATLVLLGLTVVILTFLAALFLLGFWIVRYLRAPEGPLRRTDFGVERLFGAPAGPRWLAAYDYWLYKLEDATGVEFSSTPERLMAGALIVTLGPVLLAGLPLLALDAGTAAAWYALAGGGALIAGLYAGHKLAQPAPGWFQIVGGAARDDEDDAGGFLLGEDIE